MESSSSSGSAQVDEGRCRRLQAAECSADRLCRCRASGRLRRNAGPRASAATAAADPLRQSRSQTCAARAGIGVEGDEPLALRLVRHGGDDGRQCVGRRAAESAPRCCMCGTISPAILLKRDRRSVICMNPASSIVRDVAGHVPAVAQNLRRLVGLAESSRASGSALSRAADLRGRTAAPRPLPDRRSWRRRRAADGRPCPTCVPRWRSRPSSTSGTFTATTGAISVQP